MITRTLARLLHSPISLDPVDENTNTFSVKSQNPRDTALLPDRHKQGELFLCDVSDCLLKSDIASMEHPIFSLSKTPDIRERHYEHNGNKISVIPSAKGHATIWDADILKFATSQLIAKKNQGEPIGPELRMSARSFLIFANRNTGGSDYERLEDALVRLRGTTIRTNIATGGVTQTDVFGLLESASVVRANGFGRVTGLRIKISDWLFNAVQNMEALTLSREYFQLKKGRDRRTYEIARKHCGNQPKWEISLEKFHRKLGSRMDLKHTLSYARSLPNVASFPGYKFEFCNIRSMLIFHNNKNRKAKK